MFNNIQKGHLKSWMFYYLRTEIKNITEIRYEVP